MLNKKRGFTLIELLVAIAIIGILASLLIVGITKARQKANQARAYQSFNQIALAMQLYYDKNNAWPTTFSNLVPEFYPSSDASWYCPTCTYSLGFTYNWALVNGIWTRTGPNCGWVQIYGPSPYQYIYKYALCLTNACGSTCGTGSYWPR